MYSIRTTTCSNTSRRIHGINKITNDESVVEFIDCGETVKIEIKQEVECDQYVVNVDQNIEDPLSCEDAQTSDCKVEDVSPENQDVKIESETSEEGQDSDIEDCEFNEVL